MIATFFGMLLVFTVSLVLFPTENTFLFYPFSIMVFLVGLTKVRVENTVLPFIVLASALLVLLYSLPQITDSYSSFVVLFSAFYISLVVFLRLIVNRFRAWVTAALCAVFHILLESSYYWNSDYIIDMRYSQAILTVASSAVALFLFEAVAYFFRDLKHS